MDIIKNKKNIAIVVVSIIVIITVVYYIIQTKESYIEIESTQKDLTNIIEVEQVTKKIKVHIAGYVVNEGIIEIAEGARIADVIGEARWTNC